ncbi:MAG: NAD(P)/FAD-dependent oxidoreductase [Planctomycetes bacterium]|nr:NAD(P)/FAD-dependent oxidoreductase [Planctomycetota bacterium]
MKIIIVGNGAAGISAATAIRSVDKKVEIQIVSKERDAAYSLCALPYVVSKELTQKYTARLDKDFYKQLKIKTVFGSPVCKIVPERQSVILQNGKSFSYDKLLIAAGARPVVPPIEEIDKKGVFFMDTLENTKKIMNYARKNRVKKAVIIGAGFTGIEAAMALKMHQIDVVIVEMMDRILARMLDPEIAVEALKLLKSTGVEVRLGSGVKKITGEKNASGVRLSDNKLINCGLVMVSIGVRPNIEMINGSDLQVNQGIEVDQYLRTSDPSIYAAGDVAETPDYLTGVKTINAIWPNAVEQGRVAGLNMVGQETVYDGSDSINVLNIARVPIVSMGQIEIRDKKCEIISFRNEKSFRKALIRDNVIVGFESIGPFRQLGFIWSCIKKKTDISDSKEKILRDNFVPVLQK